MGDFVTTSNLKIRQATENDVPTILSLIRELSEYENLSHEVVATEGDIRESLFGNHPVAEALIGEHEGVPISFALFFYNFSTFLGRPGIYLEDIYVKPEHRGKGFGRKLLAHVARLARGRNCGRLEWAVLKWNESAIRAYEKINAVPMDEWTIYRITGEALDKLADEN